MKIEIVSKNFKVYENFSDIVRKKLEKLDKYFEKNVSAKVLCRQERDTYVLELTIFSDIIMRAEVSNSDDMYANIDSAIAKLVRQINKHKSKLDAKFQKDFNKEKEFFAQGEVTEKASKIVKKKQYKVSPLSEEQALVKLDLIGHDFFIYQDINSGNINVIYKRKDGDVGIIESVVED